MVFNWYFFSELTTEQLYDILALRADVFVVDQQCPYLDPDGKDKYAIHLLGTKENQLLAYIRLFPPTNEQPYLIFGRVVTARNARRQEYGKQLMREMISYCQKHFPNIPIKCSAQLYLQHFYETFGLKTVGDVYDEDGIPHIAMEKI